MEKIYGGFEDRYGKLYLETFDDYDAEFERKECCFCVDDAWDEILPTWSMNNEQSFESYEFVDIYNFLVSNMDNSERRISPHEYAHYADPFDYDGCKYDHPYWNGGV